MASPSYNSPTATERWHGLSAAQVRGFHRYGTWLVSLSWWRFGWYALLLMIASGVITKLPPFSWTYTETVTDSASHHRPAMPKPPSNKPATPALPAPPSPGASAASAAAPVPMAAPVAPTPPLIHITKAPTTPSGESKTIDINLPGIVIDTKDKSLRKGGVNITFGGKGVHITTDAGDDDAKADPSAAAASAAQAASTARAGAQAVRASAAAVREAAMTAAAPAKIAAESASNAGADSEVVEMEVAGQHVRIVVPAHAKSEEIRQAVEEARQSIVESLQDAEEARNAAAQEAADNAKEAADAAREKADARMSASSDGDEDNGVEIDADGNRSTMRTHSVHYGEDIPLFAFWWILGSVLLKVTYKGRIQAEVKAAVATETAEAESLRRQVLEARMAMMQAQVEPHFLFNTLASIDHLIEFDPKRASQMQRNLISLLRASMPTMRASNESGLRPLDLELAVVRPYLEILKVRMEERLTTDIDIPDGLLSAEFPPMMIQTLVENSIKHGLEPKAEGGHLGVKAEIRHGKLCVTVSDTGLGFAAAAGGETSGTGVGLANIRERLSLLYGTKATLTIANNPAGGTIVTITVPYTAHTDDDGASK